MFKVLLVEDNRAFRGMLNELLAQRFPDLQINEAGDRDQALLLSDSVDPDLVVMDIRLPDCSGLDLTQSIKALHPQTVVIVLSMYDLPEYRASFRRFGADHFVAKESSLERLFELVERIMSDHRTH